jgi:hypothetical protein
MVYMVSKSNEKEYNLESRWDEIYKILLKRNQMQASEIRMILLSFMHSTGDGPKSDYLKCMSFIVNHDLALFHTYTMLSWNKTLATVVFQYVRYDWCKFSGYFEWISDFGPRNKKQMINLKKLALYLVMPHFKSRMGGPNLPPELHETIVSITKPGQPKNHKLLKNHQQEAVYSDPDR